MQPVVFGDVVWEPTPEVVERARLTRFMTRYGIGTFDDLLKRSVDDPEWFWDAVIHDLGIAFYRHDDQVLDESDGPEWPKWFTGGKLNIVQTCIDHWISGPKAQPDKVALIWEGEPGEVRRPTYARPHRQVRKPRPARPPLGRRPGPG